MTPGARVQAAIDLLDIILSGRPAEQALTGWARGARYAGSKDRAAVRDHVFQALRCRRSYAALGGGDHGRGLIIGELRAASYCLDDIFNGLGHAPQPLTDAEQMAGRVPAPGPEALDMPDWIWPRFTASLTETGAISAARHLQNRAPVGLRVNTRMNAAPEAIEILNKDGVVAERCDLLDSALIVTEGARRIKTCRAYAEGRVELQDIASQAAMAALEITPGARVLDLCAGGGGKTLALAARVDAQWFAHDVAPARMRDLPARAERAGIEVRFLEGDAPEREGPFDVVLCDVPCSGSGTWRRAPDSKWRFSEADLNQLITTQKAILDRAQALVRPAGILAYSTCSVLDAENDLVTEHFLARYPAWQQQIQRAWPVSETHDGFYLCTFCAPGR